MPKICFAHCIIFSRNDFTGDMHFTRDMALVKEYLCFLTSNCLYNHISYMRYMYFKAHLKWEVVAPFLNVFLQSGKLLWEKGLMLKRKFNCREEKSSKEPFYYFKQEQKQLSFLPGWNYELKSSISQWTMLA